MAFNPTPNTASDLHLPTEVGAARRIAEEWSDVLRWQGAAGRGQWMVYGRKPGVWAVDDSEDALDLAIQSCLRHEERWDDAGAFSRLAFIKNALTLAKPELNISAADFDVDPWLLNTPGGVVDLRTGETRPHAPGERFLLQTRVTPAAEWDPAETPLWVKHLSQMTHGNVEQMEYLRRLVGMSQVGDQNQKPHISPELNGRGRNGKGAFLQTVKYALGDYAQVGSSRLLTAQEGGHTTEQAGLARKRLVILEEVKRINSSLFKDLTGGGEIRARLMRQDDRDVVKTWTLWFANNNPIIFTGDGDNSDGAKQRIQVIDLGAGIPVADRLDDWVEQLKTEAAGILAWGVQGCLEWQEDGLQTPQSVKDRTERVHENNDTLAAFIAEKCEASGDDLKLSHFMKAYAKHAKAMNEKPGRNATYHDLEFRLGYTVCEPYKNGVKYIKGMTLTADVWLDIGLDSS